jgi:hypothetical protein
MGRGCPAQLENVSGTALTLQGFFLAGNGVRGKLCHMTKAPAALCTVVVTLALLEGLRMVNHALAYVVAGIALGWCLGRLYEMGAQEKTKGGAPL